MACQAKSEIPPGSSRRATILAGGYDRSNPGQIDDGRGVTMAEYKATTLRVFRALGCILALVSLISTVYQIVMKRLKLLGEAEDEFLDRVGLVTEVLGPDRYLRKVPGGGLRCRSRPPETYRPGKSGLYCDRIYDGRLAA